MKPNTLLKIKLFSLLGIIFLIFTTGVLFFEYKHTTETFISSQQEKNENIKKSAYNFLESLKSDISKKATFIVKNEQVQEAFYKKDREELYNRVIEYYNRQTVLNPYVKIMTFRLKDGSTFLRLHKPHKFGDKLNKKRKIIIDTNEEQVANYGFEIGKYKMTYRIVMPIFKEDIYLGLVEIGIEPEFLIEKLRLTFDIENALLVHKENLSVNIAKNKNYKVINEFAFVRGSKFFEDNKDKITLNKETKKFIPYNDKYYFICNSLNLYDHHNNITAKLLFATKVNNFEKRDISLINKVIVFLVLLLILFIMVNYLVNRSLKIQNEQISIIKKQSNEKEAILNGSSSIIVLSDGKSISQANEEFFKFFDEFKNIEEFKKKYDCICDKFEKIDEAGYISGKEVESETWTTHILKHPSQIFKAAIKKENKLHHFLVKVKEVKYDDSILKVIDLGDITKEIEQQKEIEEQSKTIINQTKMVALGEMIGNIAHQWRQPLSVISTSASGMQIQLELKILEENELKENLDTMIRQTDFLSKTIDDFRDFVKGEKKLSQFSCEDMINKSLNILQATFKNNQIQTVLNIEECEVKSYENELVQSMNNILNNSKDAFKEQETEDKIIFIEAKKEANHLQISIKDTAGGIPKNVIAKIFEPYFTTKHQSQGTGLGLYMTHKIIKESLEGSIEVENKTFNYQDKTYCGAEFTIKLPLSLY